MASFPVWPRPDPPLCVILNFVLRKFGPNHRVVNITKLVNLRPQFIQWFIRVGTHMYM